MKKLPLDGLCGKMSPRKSLKKKEIAEMYYTGIDLHKKTSFITTVDQEGKVVIRGNCWRSCSGLT